MLIALLVITALVVFAIAAVAVGGAVDRLAGQAPPAVLSLERATEWIADRLPYEVAAQLTHDDVARIVSWHLDYFGEVGLSSAYGEELAGELLSGEGAPVVAEDEASVDYVVRRALEEGTELTPLQVVVVLDLQLRYLVEIGAVGPIAGGSGDAAG